MRLAVPIVFLCLIAFPAQALTCREIRQAVAQHGQWLVEYKARQLGYSDQQISEIKRICRL